MNKKAVVLLSGGIDSTTCLGIAVKAFGAENVIALSVQYGQKHQKELIASKLVAEHYGVYRLSSDLSHVFDLSNCPLLSGNGPIPHQSYEDQIKENGKGIVPTYVPFRNGLMLSYSTVIALSVGAEFVYYGAHADDSVGGAYPDCTPAFASNMNSAIVEGTGGQVSLVAPLLYLNKANVVAHGIAIEAPYHLTWSCYEGAEKPCGECGTCRDREAAFAANGAVDPAIYLNLR